MSSVLGKSDCIRDLARDYFKGSSSGSHSWEHTERVHSLAQRIASLENADISIVSPAAWLHDIGRAEEFRRKGGICHAEHGAEMAERILLANGYGKQETLAICHCIRTHRFRNNKHPETLEAKVLFDADKIDSIGAVGIGRAFLFAGEVGSRLHDPDVSVSDTESYSYEDSAYREYLVKLRHIKSRMLTLTGHELAEERSRFMELFFERLNREVAGEV